MTYAYLKGQILGATGVTDPWVSVALDASGRMVIGGGANTPADNFAVPTNCAPVQAFLQAYDGSTFDLVRVRPWVSAVGNTSQSAAAIDTFAQLCGPNGIGGITVARVQAAGALTVTTAVGDIDSSANTASINYAGTALVNVYSVGLMGVSSTLPALTAGSNNKAALQGDLGGSLYVQPGPPIANARDNASANFAVDSADVPIKTSAGTLWDFHAISTEAGGVVRYLQVHNKASALVGGDVPVFSFMVTGPANVVGAMLHDFLGPHGLYFSAGIRLGWSTTVGTYTAAGTPKNVINYTFF